MSESRAERLRSLLEKDTDARLASLEIFETVDSTNAVLSAAEPPPPGHWQVAMADEQTAGRGRGANRWRSLPGAGLWMSAAYTFESPPAQVSPLTLALGVSVAEVLRKHCGAAVSLKWPNDLVLNNGKLGGMLVELASSRDTVICGIGINFRAPDGASLGETFALPPVGLVDATGDAPQRLELAARILDAAAVTLPRFVARGLAPWLDDWTDYDWLEGRQVVALQGPKVFRGTACGIDPDGALRLDDGQRVQRVVSASIRLEAERISA